MKITLTDEQMEQLNDIYSELEGINFARCTFLTDAELFIQALNEILDDGTPIYTGTIKREE